MKRIAMVSMGFLVAGLAHASTGVGGYGGPLLRREMTPAVGKEDVALGSQCTIYLDRVREAKTLGGKLQTQQTRPVEVAAESVLISINEAAKGRVTQSLGSRKAATQSYKAIQLQSDGTVRTVVLEQHGPENISNHSKAAMALKNLIDETCK